MEIHSNESADSLIADSGISGGVDLRKTPSRVNVPLVVEIQFQEDTENHWDKIFQLLDQMVNDPSD